MRRQPSKEIFLKPGGYALGDASTVIRTLLGSCVSITLWHPTRRIGAMSHFLLSSRGGPSGVELDGRYGDEAVALMLRDLVASGVSPQECQAKVFGGGSMFGPLGPSDRLNVGRDNGQAARKFLAELRIPVLAESLFGEGHRKVIFVVESGEVWARQIFEAGRVGLKGSS